MQNNRLRVLTYFIVCLFLMVWLAPDLTSVQPVYAITFTVNTTADTTDVTPGNGLCADGGGDCSLRAAIQEANAFAGADTIGFNIPGAGTQIITLGSILPNITQPLIIAGSTQPGYSGTPLIVVNANNLGGNILTVSNTNATLENFRISNAAGTSVYLSNADNSNINGLDLRWTSNTTRTGMGVFADTNTGPVTIQNIRVSTRDYGIRFTTGTDVQLLNNELLDNNNAVYLVNVTAGSLPGGVNIAGNEYTGSSTGLYFQNMANLIISDGSYPGTSVDVTDGSGNETLTSTGSQALYLINVDNSRVTAVDLSWTVSTNQFGYGLRAETSIDNLIVDDITSSGRNYGVYVSGGSDVQVLNSDLSRNSTRALQLSTITANTLPRAVIVSGNDYSNSTNGIYLTSLNNQIISDGSIVNTNINLTDGSSIHTLTTVTGQALTLNNVDNTTVEAVNLSWLADPARRGYGVYAEASSDNLTIQNISAANRQYGVYASGGSDVRVLNNNLSNNSQNALQLQTITATSLPSGILVADNTYTGSTNGVYIANQNNLIISDGSVPGTNVDLTDGSGNHTLTTVSNYALEILNSDNLRVDSVNLSWTGSASRSGSGLRIYNNTSNTVLVQNLTVNNRNTGIYIANAIDVQVLNNNLSNSGSDTNNFALFLANITANTLPGGVQVAGNDFSNSSYGVRLQNLSNLVISDGSVGGTNVNLTNGSGTHTLSTATAHALHLYNVDNSSVAALNLGWATTTSRNGVGLYVENFCDNLTLRNLNITNRNQGINANGGTDLRVLNNNLGNNGADTSNFALLLNNIGTTSLPGGVRVDGNDFTDSTQGIRLQNLSNQVISDGSVAGTTITVTNGVGNHTLTTVTGYALYLYNLDNSRIEAVDVSWLGDSTQRGNGVYSENFSDNLTIENIAAANRQIAIYAYNGNDMRILNSNLSNSGNRAIQLQNITANTLPGGVQVAGNTYTGSSTGLYLINLSNITISDGSVAGTNIDVTDGIGNHTLTTVNTYAFYLYNVDTLVVDGVNLGWTGNNSRTGYGMYLEALSDNVTLRNLTINNRSTGIYASGGTDVRVLNNNLRQNGADANRYALYLNGIGSTSLPGGVQVAGNDFSDSSYGVRLNTMSNLIISDGSVPSTNVNLTDDNGNHTLTTASGIALHLYNNMDNTSLSRLDLSWTGSTSRSGYGLYVEPGGSSNDNLTISNVIVQNRNYGLYLGSTTNANINCSTILNNTEGTWLPANSSGATLANNHFQGNSPRALRWDGAALLNAENNYWGAASGPTNLGGTGDTYLGNVDANPFLAARPACVPLGVFAVTTTADTSDGNTSNITALLIDPGADEAISLREAIAAANNTAGSQTINFNIGGGGAQTILLGSALPAITDTVTINGTSQPGFTGTTLITVDANSVAGVILSVTADNTLLRSLNIANAPGTAISLNGSDGSTLQHVNLSWTGAASGTGLDVNNSDNVVVTGLTANNRVTGLNAAASNTLTVGCSVFQTNTTGLNADATTSALSLAYSLIQGNGNGINNAAAGVLLAENNYWGAASGPLPLGGTGDNYTGNVDANPFLAVLPDCMTPSTFVVTTANDVSDGDTSSIANLVASPGADGAISLREAIAAANNTAGTDTIGFNIGGGGSQTIVLGSVLPALTDSVILDGSTQPGFSGTPLIIIDGGSLSGNLLTLQAANSTISDLVIRNGIGTALSLNNADNAQLDNLNLSWTGSTWTGTGLSVAGNSDTVTIQNLTINKRADGISVNGGSDVQVLNNDLSNSGSTTAALYMIGVTANTLPGGVVVTGNTFANAATSARLENMLNLVISDGSVVGSNVIFTPAEGLNTATNRPLYLRNVDNSSVNNLNLSWAGLFTSGTGFQADNGCANLIVQNNTATNRTTGIDISGSSDIQVLNNNLSNSGSWALQLTSITAGSLPGGVNVAGNSYTGSTSGVQLTNMPNLVISDGSAPGTNVNLTNGGGVHTLTTVRQGTALNLSNVDNTLITNVNLSWLGSGSARQGTALQISNSSDTVTVQNITATNRAMGIYVSGGRDVQILNNNLNTSGSAQNSPALYMNNVTSLSLPGGVVVTGNTFTNSAAAVSFYNMANLVISDGSIGGSNVIFTAPAGLTTVTVYPLYLNNVDNSSVRNLNLSWAGFYQTGNALQADNNSANLLIQNNTLSNRSYGLQVNNGVDVQVLNNNLSGNSTYAMYLNAITASALPGGVSISGNDYSNSANGVYLLNMNNLVISDGSASGTNINLTDGVGTHTLTTVRGTAITLSNVDNTTLSALNLSWSGGGSWQGTGISIQGGSDTVTMQNLTINNRVSGISVSSGRDIQVLNNNLNSSGSNNNSPAIYMNSVTSLSLPGGVIISGNSFNNDNSAVRFDNMTNLIISDGSIGGSNVVFTVASGMDTVFSNPLYLRNVDNSSVSNVDFSWGGALPSGFGLQADNGCNNLVIQNNNLSYRSYGMYMDNGANTNIDVLNNNLSGASSYGLYLFNVSSGADISGNDFTNDANGIYLRLMSGLTLGAATGLDTVGGTAITLYDITNSTVNGADISFSGPIRQGTGLYVGASNDTSSSNITLQNAVVNNRITGVYLERGTNFNVNCSEVLNNSTGVLAGQPGTGTNAFGVVLNQNWFQGNTTAVNNPDRTNPTPPPPTIPDPQLTNAENNYWGAANGPSNLGGSGDSYSGNVDANPFEIAIPLCVGADYGDLPAAYNLTTQADNGARHQLGALYLGNYVDFEKDGQESADAGRTAVDGDDGNKDDDEDGVAVVSPWQEGAAGGAVTVAVTGGEGCLTGWIDWNDNTSFADAGDQVMAMVEVTTGNNSLSFDVPAGALPFDGIYDRFARFRVVPDAGTPNDCSDDTPLALTGTAIDGEVEDYYLRFRKSAPTGTGPGGVGMNDATSSLVLWLAATSGTGTTTNGASVASWLDQSGYGYNATQGTGANQPTYQGNVVNGQPVLRFDNVNDGMSVADALNLADPYSVMTVFNSNAAAAPHRAVQGRDTDWLIGPHSGEIRHYAGGWVSTGVALTPGQFTIAGAINLGAASSFRVNGVDQTTDGTFIGAPGRLGLGATGVVADPLGGDLAEVIVYEDALNSARRIIVENYLSAKYNLSISNDRYDGDTPGNGNFDLNVAGIGLEADGDNYRAHSAGMIVQDNVFLINSGDYLLFGHNTVNNGNTNADVPVGGDWNGVNDVRWLRHWYIDVTDIGNNNGTVDIIFDFSEASMDGGLPPNLPTSNYRLLKRTGITGQFSDITTLSGATVLVVGDQVQFLGVNVTQLGSNFTLGSIDGSTSPTVVTMQQVSTQNNQSGYLALVIGALILLAATVRFVWQRTS